MHRPNDHAAGPGKQTATGKAISIGLPNSQELNLGPEHLFGMDGEQIFRFFKGCCSIPSWTKRYPSHELVGLQSYASISALVVCFPHDSGL